MTEPQEPSPIPDPGTGTSDPALMLGDPSKLRLRGPDEKLKLDRIELFEQAGLEKVAECEKQGLSIEN